LSLHEWDKRLFEKPHSLSTLRKWAREGYIHPEPELIGSRYEVLPSARYVRPNTDRLSKLRQIKAMQQANLPESLNAAAIDPEMLEILDHGISAA
ncbi:MAG: excisionase, partial [Motiliproteus sp.]